jgi:8-oxo-dGTP pyrophosphatase MutT (NUDIX family)
VAGSSPAAGSIKFMKQLIPKHAKRVFKGTVFDIHQWEQKMFDGRTETFERAKTLNGATVIATVGNKVVLLKQKQPGTNWYYSLPGGYLDKPGETPREGALRELMEETGLKPKRMKLWKTYSNFGRVATKSYLFIAQDCTKVGEPNLDGGEIIKTSLITFDEFLKLSDQEDFNYRDLIIELLRARLTKKGKAEFKKLIFGK